MVEASSDITKIDDHMELTDQASRDPGRFGWLVKEKGKEKNGKKKQHAGRPKARARTGRQKAIDEGKHSLSVPFRPA